jgi:RimJ/RimL family protein N-acetyltransferase
LTTPERIWLDAIDYNLRAQHVYGKLGFVKEGLLRECYIRPDGRRVSLVIMSLLRHEWRSD